jgi:hypothetical protein
VNEAVISTLRDRKRPGRPDGEFVHQTCFSARAVTTEPTRPALNHKGLDRVSMAIEAELERFASSSPIARGPAELSHSVLRLLEHSDYPDVLNTSDRLAFAKLRSAFVAFIACALGQHAKDRGFTYAASNRSLSCLIEQLELWAKLLPADTPARKRIRVAIQLALAEELNASITRL